MGHNFQCTEVDLEMVVSVCALALSPYYGEFESRPRRLVKTSGILFTPPPPPFSPYPEISCNHRLNYVARVLNDARCRKLAVLMTDTENIWDNPKYNKAGPLTLNNL